MMPDNVLSTTSAGGRFLTPSRYDKLIDYEWAGDDFYNTSSGMLSKLWRSKYENNNVILYNDTVSHTVLTLDNIESISFAFDYNMRYVLTYVRNNHAYLVWYNSTSQEFETRDFGEDVKTPQLALDEHRPINSENADVIFAYIRDGLLRTRIQRDRYDIEYTHDAYDELVQIGMMNNYRFGFVSRSINVYNYTYDLGIIAPHNKPELNLNFLDLIAEQPQSTIMGDNALRAYGSEFNTFANGKKNIINTVSVSYLIDESQYDYFMCFYRVWQHNLKPFYTELVLEKREPELHKCHFVPDSVSMSTVGNMFRITATLSLIDKNRNKADYKELARSRN